MKQLFLSAGLCMMLYSPFATAQSDYQTDSVFIRKIFNAALSEGKSYEMLRNLTKTAPGRLSGSPAAAKAVELTRQTMVDEKFDNVFLQNVMVPHWVRGAKEQAYIVNGAKKT